MQEITESAAILEYLKEYAENKCDTPIAIWCTDGSIHTELRVKYCTPCNPGTNNETHIISTIKQEGGRYRAFGLNEIEKIKIGWLSI